MKNAKIALLIKYAICFGIASLIAVIVFAMKGFFTNDTSVNIQILIDGFFVSGILFLFAGGLQALARDIEHKARAFVCP